MRLCMGACFHVSTPSLGLKSQPWGWNPSLGLKSQPRSSNPSLETQIPAPRLKSKLQGSNPSLKAPIPASRLKSQPQGSNPVSRLKSQPQGSKLKFQPQGSNLNLKAQILASQMQLARGSPYVLEDIVSFGAAALLTITYNHKHTKQGKGYRWPHIAFGGLVYYCPCSPAQVLGSHGSSLVISIWSWIPGELKISAVEIFHTARSFHLPILTFPYWNHYYMTFHSEFF